MRTRCHLSFVDWSHNAGSGLFLTLGTVWFASVNEWLKWVVVGRSLNSRAFFSVRPQFKEAPDTPTARLCGSHAVSNLRCSLSIGMRSASPAHLDGFDANLFFKCCRLDFELAGPVDRRATLHIARTHRLWKAVNACMCVSVKDQLSAPCSETVTTRTS